MDDPSKISSESDNKEDSSAVIPDDAFLVLEGIKVVPLAQAIINIGRRFENHIAIDDPRVSRYHAQLRVVDGRFVLLDLNSSGGTYINGMRISKSILYPGDEISLAGFTMVYRQHDAPPRTDLRETSPLRSD
jgi:pSer/pThr/pTyr-binding forkhead associated (FHA) protein